MTEYVLSEETRAKLMRTSTASIATQLYKRGLRNQFIQGVKPVAPKKKNMVGQAFTLRYIPPVKIAIHLKFSVRKTIRNVLQLKPARLVMCW